MHSSDEEGHLDEIAENGREENSTAHGVKWKFIVSLAYILWIQFLTIDYLCNGPGMFVTCLCNFAERLFQFP